MDKREKRKMLYELERLTQTNGDPKRISELRLQLGITESKKKMETKPVVEDKPKIEEKPKVAVKAASGLTIEIYNDLKAQGKSDAVIGSEYNMHNANFYAWKKKNGLITPRKKQDEPKEPKTEVVHPDPAPAEDKQPSALQRIIERPESEHYHTGSIDVWMFADENFIEDEVIGFHRISAIKYIARYGKKKGKNIIDLKKAIAEIEKLIELEEAK